MALTIVCRIVFLLAGWAFLTTHSQDCFSDHLLDYSSDLSLCLLLFQLNLHFVLPLWSLTPCIFLILSQILSVLSHKRNCFYYVKHRQPGHTWCSLKVDVSHQLALRLSPLPLQLLKHRGYPSVVPLPQETFFQCRLPTMTNRSIPPCQKLQPPIADAQ